MKIGCVLLAAGNGARFGGNKLLTDFQAKPLIQYAFEVIPQGLRVLVISQYEEILAMARARGYEALKNAQPELGQSHSIKLGLAALSAMDGILFLVGDQPLLQKSSLEGLMALFQQNPHSILALSYKGRRGNPVLFPRDFFRELMELQGDWGGRTVLKAHPERLLLYEVQDPWELWDVDRPEHLSLLHKEAKPHA